MAHFVLGTAGHIDHGKTALVLALTGVDTDRWAEEKRRGITIDLGFAPIDLGGGITASVVDVPGHEAFVKNMLAGATGIDLALLVVAADEGIMPQTLEHVAILELLGVKRGIPAVTKTDLVEDDWLDLVTADIDQRLRESPISWSEPVFTSAIRNEGIDELRACLRTIGHEVETRSEDDLFRLPIDRVFSLAGAGTVVTGTTWSGGVTKGDVVRILPADLEARIRSIETHGNATSRALPARRTALALVGLPRDAVGRGGVAVDDAAWRPTRRFSCAVRLLDTAPRELRRREGVRVHLGTAAVMARLLAPSNVRPGGQLDGAVLETEVPVVARAGDRFVLRAASPVTTIGGGIVWDPYHEWGVEPTTEFASLVRGAGVRGVRAADLPIRLALTRPQAQALAGQPPPRVIRVGDRLVEQSAISALSQSLQDRVAEYHRSHVLEAGMSLQELRSSADASGDVVEEAIRLAAEQGAVLVEEGVVREPGWDVHANPETARMLERLGEAVVVRQLQFASVGELEAEFGVDTTRPLLAVLARAGTIRALDREHYVGSGALGAFEERLRDVLRDLGSATPSQLREAFQLTRKHLIPLLEWADREGITRRQGDTRVLVA